MENPMIARKCVTCSSSVQQNGELLPRCHESSSPENADRENGSGVLLGDEELPFSEQFSAHQKIISDRVKRFVPRLLAIRIHDTWPC